MICQRRVQRKSETRPDLKNLFSIGTEKDVVEEVSLKVMRAVPKAGAVGGRDKSKRHEDAD